MIDKIKEYLFKVIAPLAFVLGYVYYLVTKNTSLRRELEVEKIEKQQAQFEAEQKELKNEADNAVDRYIKLRDEYVRTGDTDVQGSNRGGGSGNSGETE